MLLPIARGDGQRMAELFEQRLPIDAAGPFLALLGAFEQDVAQLGGDVVGVLGGQVAADGREIAIQQVHHLSPFSVSRRIDSEIAFHSPRSWARIAVPSALSR